MESVIEAHYAGQFRLDRGKLLHLAGVVRLDDALHRLGAGVGSLLADQGGGGPEGEAGGGPQRREQARPHAPFGQEAFEGLQVILFLAPELGERLGGGVLAPGGGEHRLLAPIDLHGRQLAGVIDAQDLRRARLQGAGAGARRNGSRARGHG